VFSDFIDRHYLYKQDVESAENALTIAVQLSEGVENIDPSFKRVIDIEAPMMLKIYKNNVTIQSSAGDSEKSAE
jgi:hypothetical protein